MTLPSEAILHGIERRGAALLQPLPELVVTIRVRHFTQINQESLLRQINEKIILILGTHTPASQAADLIAVPFL